MNSITIGAESIREIDGLYSLNDLHWAAGGLPSQKPSEWLRNRQTQELIAEIEKAGIPAIKSKQKLGTYACRELVIAYAAWISPAFHLKVIRVFLDQTASPRHTTTPITAATGPAATGPAAAIKGLTEAQKRFLENIEKVAEHNGLGESLNAAELALLHGLITRKAREVPVIHYTDLINACYDALHDHFGVYDVKYIPAAGLIEAVCTLANVFRLYTTPAKSTRPAQAITLSWLQEGGASYTAEGLTQVVLLASKRLIAQQAFEKRTQVQQKARELKHA